MALTNEVRLIGYCAIDPMLRQLNGERVFCRLPIYTEHWYTNRSTGTLKKFKERHLCVFFDNNAARAQKLLMKGSQVHLRGTLHYYQKNPQSRQARLTEIIVDEFMLSSRAIVTKELYQYIFNEDKEIKKTTDPSS